MSKHKKTQGDLKEPSKQMGALAGRLESVREEERKKLARQIHDEIGQALMSIKLDLRSLLLDGMDRSDAQAEKVESLLRLLDETLVAMHRIASDLRPGVLDDLGLPAAIEWAVEDFQVRSRVPCALSLPQHPLVSDSRRDTAIFRILQEALRNVVHHAQATQVRVSLTETSRSLVLEVRDNGRGITEAQSSSPKSLGIIGMRERAVLVGGNLVIRRVARQGTIVAARVPRSMGRRS